MRRNRRHPWRLCYRNSNRGTHGSFIIAHATSLYRARRRNRSFGGLLFLVTRTPPKIAGVGGAWWRARAGGVRASPLLRVAGGLPLFFRFVWGCSLWLLLRWAFVAALRLGFGCLVVRGCFALARAVRFGLSARGGRRLSRAAVRLWARRLPCFAFGLRLWGRAGAWLWRGFVGLASSAGVGAFALRRLSRCRFRRCFRRRGGRGRCLRFGGLCCWRGLRVRRRGLALRGEAAFAVVPVGCLLAGFFFVRRNSNPIAIMRATAILRATEMLRTTEMLKTP